MFDQFTAGSPGVGFVGSESGTSFPIDLFSQQKPSNLFILGQARSGKTVLTADFVVDGLSRQVPAVILDWVEPSWHRNSYVTMATFFKSKGVSAFSHRASEVCGNVIALPDLSDTPDASLRLELLLSVHVEIIRFLVLEDQSHPQSVDDCVTSLVNDSYRAFQADGQIQKRYAAALSFKPSATQGMPMLVDYLGFARVWLAQLSAEDEHQQRCIALVLSQLYEKLSGERSILAKPVTVQPDAALLMLMIGDLTPEDAILKSLSALSASLFRCLRSSRSLLVLDDMILLDRSEVLRRVLCLLGSAGQALGLTILLSQHDIDSLLDTPSGIGLLGGFSTRLLGRTAQRQLRGLDAIGFPPEVATRYTDCLTYPLRNFTTDWHLNCSGACKGLQYQPKALLIALMTSQTDACVAREQILNKYPNDSLAGLQEFSEVFVRCVQNDISFELLKR